MRDYLFEHRVGQDSVFRDVHSDLYNRAKERFVSDLSGCDWFEVVAIISILPLSYFVLNAALQYLTLSQRIAFPDHIRVIFEFIMLILPTMFTFCHQTNPSSSSYTIITSMIFIHLLVLFLLFIASSLQNLPLFSFNPNDMAHGANNNRKEFISYYRSTLMLFTILSILAVDFTVFPRKYAKTETYGFSLMDVGVGSFIISMGIISKLKSSANEPNANRDRARYGMHSLLDFMKAFRSSIPLFLFGVVRVVMLWAFGYHSHVSEYGVHWNFFFTMFVVTISSFFLNLSHIPIVILAVSYQTFLCWFGSDYVFHQERTAGNLISENKEGIMSCIGFFVTFHLGQWIGRLLSSPMTTKRQLFQIWTRFVMLLGVVMIHGAVMHLFVEKASRRLANIAYISFVIGCNLWIIILFMVPCMVLFYRNDSVLLRAINHNQLFVFLIGNLMTGMINLKLKTLFAVPSVAYSLIGGYLMVLCATVYFLFRTNIKIRI